VKVVALLVRLPAIVNGAAPVSFQVAPEFRIISPVKVLVPVLASVKVPATVVVPVTVSVQVFVAPVAKVVPEPTERFPPMVMAAAVVTEAVPLRVRFVTVVPALSVFAPEPERVRLANAFVPVMVCAAPFRLTVPVFAVNVPLLDQPPPTTIVPASPKIVPELIKPPITVRVPEKVPAGGAALIVPPFVKLPLTIKVAAPEIVSAAAVPVPVVPTEILLHTAAPFIVGYEVNPLGIVTLVIASGTDPQDQLPGVVHNPSRAAPVQRPGVQPLELTLITPVF